MRQASKVELFCPNRPYHSKPEPLSKKNAATEDGLLDAIRFLNKGVKEPAIYANLIGRD